MKYKVSLLPESHKKQINGKKKAERIKVWALIALVILFALFVLVFVSKLVSDKKLSDAKALDNSYAQKVDALAKYRDINAELQNKVKLIDDIKVKEPALYTFIVKLGNIEHTGVSIAEIQCDDWKYSRQCTVAGSTASREEYLAYEAALKELPGVQSVECTDYVSAIGASDGQAQFVTVITVEGGMQLPDATDASFAPTTVVDENGGLQTD